MHSLGYIYMSTDTPYFMLTIYNICNILLIDDVVDPHHVALVDVSGVDDTGDEHNDIGTDDAMLLVVHKYESFCLRSCKLPTM